MGATISLEQEFAGVDEGARYMSHPSSMHVLLLPAPRLEHVLLDVADSVVYRARWRRRIRPFIYTSLRPDAMSPDIVVSYDPMAEVLDALHRRLQCLPEEFIALHSLARDHMRKYCDVPPLEFRDATASFNDLAQKVVAVLHSPLIATRRLKFAGTGMVVQAHSHHRPYGGVYQTIHVVQILNNCLIVDRMLTDATPSSGGIAVGYWPDDSIRQQRALLERCDYRVTNILVT